jgi:gamma-glutamyl hydrolase
MAARLAALLAALSAAALCSAHVSLRLADDDVGAAASGSCAERTSRPVIGVLTQPDRELGEYVAGSYVKYLEGAGARVVALRYGADAGELRRLFDGVHGLLLPGGAADLAPGHPFFDASMRLFEWAIEANHDRGDVFPIWGTCLGFEQLGVLAAGANASVLSSGFDSEDLASRVSLTRAGALAASEGRGLLGSMPAELLRALQEEDIAFNAHQMGIEPSVFDGNERLRNFFTPLATGADRKGRAFIAAYEAQGGL